MDSIIIYNYINKKKNYKKIKPATLRAVRGGGRPLSYMGISYINYIVYTDLW